MTCTSLRTAFNGAVKDGLGAIQGKHRGHLSTRGSVRIDCSVDLDAFYTGTEPTENRWDYVVIVKAGRSRSVAVEVHHATAGEVKAVIAKRDWALKKLAAQSPAAVPSPADWHWIASGKVFLRATDPQFRVLKKSGVQGPMRHLAIA